MIEIEERISTPFMSNPSRFFSNRYKKYIYNLEETWQELLLK